MSRAYDLFSKIRAGGFQAVEQMVRDGVTEEPFLDYKNVATRSPSTKLHDSDRKNCAKAISGFGNSDGGIVIWGVDCRMDPSKGDVPNSIVAIPNTAWFKTLLDGQTSGMTLPAHPGVENFAAPKPSAAEGVVVSYIPEALNVPLRGVPDGANQYYIRAGSSFLAAPHGVLSGMFGRRPQARLVAALVPFHFSRKAEDQATASIAMVLSLRNTGRGVADDAVVTIEMQSQRCKLNVNIDASMWHQRWNRDQEQNNLRLSLISEARFTRIPPGDRIELGNFHLEIQRYQREGIAIRLTCGSRDSAGTGLEISLSENQTERIAELALFVPRDADERQRHMTEIAEIFTRGMLGTE